MAVSPERRARINALKDKAGYLDLPEMVIRPSGQNTYVDERTGKEIDPTKNWGKYGDYEFKLGKLDLPKEYMKQDRVAYDGDIPEKLDLRVAEDAREDFENLVTYINEQLNSTIAQKFAKKEQPRVWELINEATPEEGAESSRLYNTDRFRAKVSDALRTPEQQAYFVEHGTSGYPYGLHMLGRAIDLDIYDNGQYMWDAKYMDDNKELMDAVKKMVIDAAAKYGLVSGGTFSSPDWPHFDTSGAMQNFVNTLDEEAAAKVNAGTTKYKNDWAAKKKALEEKKKKAAAAKKKALEEKKKAATKKK
jgi:hypothetical protein